MYVSRVFAIAILAVSVSTIAAGRLSAADPTATDYTFEQCCGSAMPYPAPASPSDCPDSLKPVMISHVGRHGARFPASAKHALTVKSALQAADSLGTITPDGRDLLALTERVISLSAGRWGALDSLGQAEQRGIASRMYANYPMLFNGRVDAISSYSPRCVMSMYTFLHQLCRLNNRVEMTASSGREYSPLLRFFDDDREYTDFSKGDTWREAYDNQLSRVDVEGILSRVLGKGFPFGEIDGAETAMAEYSLLAGTAAMGIDGLPSRFLTLEQMNSLWQCFNLRQYLLRSFSVLSSVPAEIAAPLLKEIVDEADMAVSGIEAGTSYVPVRLRFGHAETLMPLLSLMRLRGAYYLTNYFDTVGLHWLDFTLVPMAANLQMVLFQSDSGQIYLRCDLNETPVPLMAGDDRLYLPWGEARAYLIRCIPLWAQ
ncbi:MAG: histidine phosphatase family protein [Clostridium sp.]|nr:histidine phosphatase family protein [Clostridium sp.]